MCSSICFHQSQGQYGIRQVGSLNKICGKTLLFSHILCGILGLRLLFARVQFGSMGTHTCLHAYASRAPRARRCGRLDVRPAAAYVRNRVWHMHTGTCTPWGQWSVVQISCNIVLLHCQYTCNACAIEDVSEAAGARYSVQHKNRNSSTMCGVYDS